MDYRLSDFKPVRHFVLDIDGVLTDGSLLIDSDGTILRTMNIKDGYAMQLAIKKGYSISIISGASGDGLHKRFSGLGILDVHLGVSAKMEKFNDVIRTGSLDTGKTLYMGDDMPDLEAMRMVSMPCCPADACEEIKQLSRYISPFPGGKGCVRDVIEKVLKLNGHWE